MLNNELVAALKVRIKNMLTLRPRRILLSLADALVCISYSDGEGEGADVGIALW